MGWLQRLMNPAAATLSHRPRDRVAELADRTASIDRLEAKLARMKTVRLHPHELVSWHVLWIATAFRRDDRDEAFRRARQAMDVLPDHPEILFALGQEHEFRNELDDMLRHFRSSLFPRTTADHALTAVRYCYLRGMAREGLELLKPLLKVHFDLAIADDHFLYMRRLPFAHITFGTLACLHLVNGTPEEARIQLRKAARKLSDCDLSPLMTCIDAAERRQPALVTAMMQAQRAPHLSAGPFGGREGVRYAVWTARSQTSQAEAEAALSRARLTEHDHAWLSDARALAVAELRHRFGDTRGEADAVRALLIRQPLLLEPHWAVEFGFVEYQERLRKTLWLQHTGRSSRAI